jgi:predicted GNAT superfamily acetyltransferase
MPRTEIRLLKTGEEYRQCERIQKRVWGDAGVGAEVLTVTQKYGGVVLGALEEGKVVGFIYAFLGEYRGRLIHWSHLMAVEAGFRDRGLGFRMKLAHRKLALARGIRSICWTYDPLESRNAALNIGRLGGQVEEYLVNCYGQFPSRIEKGLESDRFVLNWRLDSARVKRRLQGERPRLDLGLPRVNETRPNAQGFIENRRIRWNLADARLLVEIPSNTDRMREKSLPLARRWREQTRKIFGHYLSKGWVVREFAPPGPAIGNRSFYVLAAKPAGR